MSKISAIITGVGPISAIGCGRQDFWQALISGRHGFGPITLCDVSFSPSRIGAEVKNFKLEQFIENGRVLSRRLPRPVQFALAASSLALEDAGLNGETLNKERVGCASALLWRILQTAWSSKAVNSLFSRRKSAKRRSD